METVQRAMIRAAERFGGDDGIFNAAGFSQAMSELSGVSNLLDGEMVRAILDGRLDVEALPGGAHFRCKAVVSRTEESRRKGVRPICVDFDGVLHSYDSGWKGACEIPDLPVPGALDWLRKMSQDARFEICVYSSRSKEPGAIAAMIDWFLLHGLTKEDLVRIKFPNQKPAATLLIDDRAFRFEGVFPTAEWIINYKPWNKRLITSTVTYPPPTFVEGDPNCTTCKGQGTVLFVYARGPDDAPGNQMAACPECALGEQT